MNREQRRAAGHGRKPNDLFRPCRPENLAAASLACDQAGHPGLAELMRQLVVGGMGLIAVQGRDAALDQRELAKIKKPTLVLVGDDDYSSTGPSGWRCAATVTVWAKFALVHAAAATADRYREAAEAARIIGAAALIETDAQHAIQWAQAFVGKTALVILPREGVHPIMPARSTLQ